MDNINMGRTCISYDRLKAFISVSYDTGLKEVNTNCVFINLQFACNCLVL